MKRLRRIPTLSTEVTLTNASAIVVCQATSDVSVTLPAAPPHGMIIGVEPSTETASAVSVTVGDVGQTIDEPGVTTVEEGGPQILFQFCSTNNRWYIING